MTNDVRYAGEFNMNLDDNTTWNESSWLSFAIPERKINGFVYYFFRPNMNCLNGGVAMWDLTGEYTWDCLFWDWQFMRELPPGEYGVDYNKYDFKAPWSLSCETVEPLQKYRFGYDLKGCKLDLLFEGVAEPHPMASGEEGQLNRSQRFHFEQPGTMKGTIELEGEKYEVDCYSIRDGSHGPRTWDEVPAGGYTWSTASDKSAFHLIAVDDKDSHETKILGGYYMKDGILASLVSGVRRVVQRKGPMPTIVEVEATDAMGRKLEAIGRITVPALFHYYSYQVQWFSQFVWDYDGHVGAIGEDQEYYPVAAMRSWMRSPPGMWKTR
ncbi:MAG: hypothetical protein KDE55_16865 [Novosphingobium sp.]|nr:hypothetical protein [Novosphingobium sp.]